jgi:hypothetical protein
VLGLLLHGGVASVWGEEPSQAVDSEASPVLEIGGSRIEIAFDSPQLGQRKSVVTEWISAAARAVTTYYGRFPVNHFYLEIRPVEGREIHGTTYGHPGAASTRIRLGQQALETSLERSWVMAHEMVHLAFPQVPDAHHWIEEGIATYVEPVARAQAGQLPVETVWGDLVAGLPKGLPAEGDRGLDYTHTWGRTYWGGALFCLLADVDIRERTANQRGLQDALRAIVAAGGSIEVRWPIAHAFEVADRAIGVPVLSELYERMKATPVSVALEDLWRRLGVEMQGGTVVFDENAPLAAIRRGITAPR